MRYIFYSACLLVFLTMISSVSAQTEDPWSPLSTFLLKTQNEASGAIVPVETFSAQKNHFAREEYKIVQYLNSLRAYIGDESKLDPETRKQITAFIDNEVVWFEQHINTVLEAESENSLIILLPEARVRYLEYSLYIHDITRKLQIAALRNIFAEIEVLHREVADIAGGLNSDTEGAVDIMQATREAESYFTTARSELGLVQEIVDSTHVIRIVEAIKAGLSADIRATSLIEKQVPGALR
jgi:hypothetical protein